MSATLDRDRLRGLARAVLPARPRKVVPLRPYVLLLRFSKSDSRYLSDWIRTLSGEWGTNAEGVVLRAVREAARDR